MDRLRIMQAATALPQSLPCPLPLPRHAATAPPDAITKRPGSGHERIAFDAGDFPPARNLRSKPIQRPPVSARMFPDARALPVTRTRDPGLGTAIPAVNTWGAPHSSFYPQQPAQIAANARLTPQGANLKPRITGGQDACSGV